MKLTAYDKQLALDYIIYMMMGSFFPKTTTAFKGKEKLLRLRYLLLGHKDQYELEERCERYFGRNILPELPEDFLKSCADVRWEETKDKRYTAVVFSSNGQELRVISLYGGKYKTPIFRHRFSA